MFLIIPEVGRYEENHHDRREGQAGGEENPAPRSVFNRVFPVPVL